MSPKNVENTYTDETAKFAAGNPGKPKGARHKTTLAIEELLNDEADGLTRKAIELALEGDTTALRLCLERIWAALCAVNEKDFHDKKDAQILRSKRSRDFERRHEWCC